MFWRLESSNLSPATKHTQLRLGNFFNIVVSMERFWNKVIKQPNGCWEWQGSLDRSGYGQFKLYDTGHGKGSQRQKVIAAHRMAWKLEKGQCPPYLCHKCDNRKCVNPSHLYEGSPQENSQDRSRRHPGWACRSLSDHIIRRIRREYFIGFSSNQLSNKYSISKHTVLKIINGKVRTETGGPIRNKSFRYYGNRYRRGILKKS